MSRTRLCAGAMPVVLALGVTPVLCRSDEPKDKPAAKGKTAAEASKEWAYPGAESRAGVGITDGPLHTVTVETADPFGKVWEFYAKRCGFGREFDAERDYKTHGKTKDGVYLINDTLAGDGRARSHSFFVYRAAGLTVTAVVCRADDGKKTRVYLSVATP